MRLYVGKVKKSVRKNAFGHRMVDMWNNLPEKIVSASNINIFKNRLDSYWAKEGMKYDFTKSYNKFRSNVVMDDQGLFDLDETDSDDTS